MTQILSPLDAAPEGNEGLRLTDPEILRSSAAACLSSLITEQWRLTTFEGEVTLVTNTSIPSGRRLIELERAREMKEKAGANVRAVLQVFTDLGIEPPGTGSWDDFKSDKVKEFRQLPD